MAASSLLTQVIKHSTQILKLASEGSKLLSKTSAHTTRLSSEPSIKPSFGPDGKPTTSGIAHASNLLSQINGNMLRHKNLRAGDIGYNDDDSGYNSNGFSSYGNTGLYSNAPHQQDLQIKPLTGDQEKLANSNISKKAKDLVHDIFEGDPSSPDKQDKIAELLPLLKPDAQGKLLSIANKQNIAGHGNRKWEDLKDNERDGFKSYLQSQHGSGGLLTHSEGLLHQQTLAAQEDQKTAFFANRLMSANNMMATFMTELAQLSKKYIEMLRSSV
ncbi:MAG: hypothetical protein RLZZ210_985 [Pseudomonadota bacterium]|jgi:hypothetical protein